MANLSFAMYSVLAKPCLNIKWGARPAHTHDLISVKFKVMFTSPKAQESRHPTYIERPMLIGLRKHQFCSGFNITKHWSFGAVVDECTNCDVLCVRTGYLG